MSKAPTRTLRTFKYAMYFDGGSSYVQVPYLAVFNQRPFSVEAWTAHNAHKLDDSIFSCADDYAADRYLHLVIRYNYPYLGFWADDLWGKSLLDLAVWYHLVFAWEGPDTKRQLIYVNAELDASRTSTGLLTVVSGAHTGNGCWVGRIDSIFLLGYINTIRVYSRALSAEEVAHNYNNPDNPVRDGLILWLRADPQNIKDIDNDGSLEWIDLSGFGNHGKIYGAALVEVIKPPARVLSPVRVVGA